MIKKLLGIVVCLAVLGVSQVHAQQYPTKVITMMVPFAAGGPTDTVARLVAKAIGDSLKQQIIVENVGGASGTIAANRVAKAAPDGYTILIYHIGMSTAAETGYTLEELEPAFDQLIKGRVWSVNDGMPRKMIQFNLDNLVRIGRLPAEKKPTYEQMVDLSPTEAALKSLGKWTDDPGWR